MTVFKHKEILTQRTAIKRRQTAPMHEMVMAAIIPAPPTPPSDPPSDPSSGEVDPMGSTVLT
jgi:hypothetical protein